MKNSQAQEGKIGYFVGESAKTEWNRGQDHMKALKNGDRSYARQGQSWDYPMEITGLFDRHLYRQATEGYILQQYPGDVLINWLFTRANFSS